MNFKYIIISALIIIFFGSCQKESIYEQVPDAIRFTAGVSDLKEVETKSDLVTGSTLPDGSNFGVLGYCVPYMVGTTTPNYAGASGDWNAKMANSYPDIFYKKEVNYSDGECTYDTPEGWVTTANANSDPAKYTYTFFAYYPSTAWTVDTGSTALGAPKFSYTIPITSNNTGNTISDSNITDVMVASVFNHLRSNGHVPLNFSHVTTGLNVKVVNYDTRTIQIRSITLKGTYHKKVTIDFATGALSYSGTYKGTFTLNNGTSRVNPGASVNVDNGETALLLSNAGIGSDVQMTVTYRVGGSTTDKTWNSGTSLTSANFKPNPGTNYTLTLNFVNGAITLSTEAEEQWENGDDDKGNNSTIK